MFKSTKLIFKFHFFISAILLLLYGKTYAQNENYESLKFFMQDCFKLVEDGDFGMTGDELYSYLKQGNLSNEEIYLEAHRETMLEWLSCERQKLNELVFDDGSFEQPGGVTEINADMRSFIESSDDLRSIEKATDSLSIKNMAGFTLAGVPLAGKAQDFSENDKIFISKSIKELIVLKTNTENDIENFIRIRGIKGSYVREAYRFMARYLRVPAHDLVFWDSLIKEIESKISEIKSSADTYRRSYLYNVQIDTPAQAKKLEEQRAEVQRVTDNLLESRLKPWLEAREDALTVRYGILHGHHILAIKDGGFIKKFFGTSESLYEELTEIYPEDLNLYSDEEIEIMDEKGIDLIRGAVAHLEEINKEAIFNTIKMKNEDLLKLAAMPKLRELVNARLGEFFREVESGVVTRLENTEKNEKIKRFIIYSGGALLGLVGGMICPPSMVITSQVLLSAGSAVILAGVSFELKNAVNTFKDADLYLNAGSGESIGSIEEGEALLDDLRLTCVAEFFAILGAAVQVKTVLRTMEVLEKAKVKAYSPSKLAKKLKKARYPIRKAYKEHPELTPVLKRLSRLITLSRNGDRLSGLARRFSRAASTF